MWFRNCSHLYYISRAGLFKRNFIIRSVMYVCEYIPRHRSNQTTHTDIFTKVTTSSKNGEVPVIN
jgi:hypothetical protein